MKIIHTSDIHIASPLTSKLPPEKSKLRAAEIASTFAKICAGADALGAKAVIIAGDLFDTSRVTKKVLDVALSSIESAGDIKFFYLCGNHEKNVLLTSGVSLPENLLIFGEEWTYFDIGDVTVVGRSTVTPDMTSELKLKEERKNIVVLHAELRDYASTGAIGLNDLKGKNIDYLALGHYHTYSKKEIDRRGIAVYSGCPEGRGFDEVGECGIVLIDTDELLSPRFIPLAKRRMRIIELDATGAESTFDIEERIKEKIAEIPKEDLIRVLLTGSRGIESRWDTEILCSKFEDRFFYFETKDNTKLSVCQEDFRFDKSLKGEFIRLCLSDATLDQNEKEKIINCGILALAGESFD